ncbi:cbb3-type cytochrome oxidase assembly protein CcoS [Microbulbifer sp. SA54]|uniref:cbb3-type cytochrome oxidase assembly protein CcoS n=1 Tax=Microbulbifer sp. SA54 TaxID=3401577 RepID=UPI003AAA8042
MDSIFLLVPIVIVFIVLAVKFFFWAVNNGQYDDLETEGRRILFDDESETSRSPGAARGGEVSREDRQREAGEP